ncbi:magnesium transporter [Serratia fonticola]|jgi:magnesium transporter|uniref:magnesium transporter n=1 Tax=Serratia fonticola TaxID=47917 RepID=UPI000742EFE2|nr:magnesium transporter [Serratia fonticola]ALX96023.1 magnesium transporter [Serratia fonticola]MBC3251757.1 magnesium transporter [Serratia fonticola]NXZ86648.1 magnesium transporter [Serratia fonticola]OIX84838.1 magnesium transporter [Serratia fonticola]QCR62318.1 magnesium transporter [Serratia fonticola]
MSHVVLQDLYQNANFEDDAIARYMNKKVSVLHQDLYVGEARKIFVNQLSNDDIPAQIFIEDGTKLVGVLSVKRLLQEEHNGERIKDMMETTFFHVKPTDEREHIAKLVDNNNLDIVAVVDNGRLVGCLTEREIAQIIEDENTEDAHLQGASLPLDKPYLEMSSFELWKKRSVWLLLLFVAEAYTSTVIQHFEESLEAAIALAFFIPLLVGTGGNSGTQITSTIVRAMALGEVRMRDLGRVLSKEMTTSIMIALTLACAGAFRGWMMGIGYEITLIVSLTLVCITLWAAIVSSVIPMALKRFGVDPAVVSAPFITTLIDGTGLIIYFKIAQWTLGLN